MKGIILAGGAGTRLYPITRGVSKHLLPVYDKPMAYYPLTTLMMQGCREILVIVNPRDNAAFERALGDGSQWGVELWYETQGRPRGIADALIIAESWLGEEDCVLALGDNLHFGLGPFSTWSGAGAKIYAARVADPERYGVIELERGRPVSIQEKPRAPRSDLAVTGLYAYDSVATLIAKGLEPSMRGELEITGVNRAYMERRELRVCVMGEGTAWFDCGSPDALYEATGFVRAMQRRQGTLVGSPDLEAYRLGWTDAGKLRDNCKNYVGTEYGQALLTIAEAEA